MTIAIIGARGCVGNALIQKLLETTSHTIIASYRRDEAIGIKHERVVWKRINLYDDLGTEEFLRGADVAVYLVHSLVSARFASLDRAFAFRTGKCARVAGVKKIIYLGGVVPQHERLSVHLKSRREVGEQLARAGVPVAEIRASIILATCSASYRMIYWLSRRLPVIMMPKWGKAACSPIALTDVVDALTVLIDRTVDGHEIFEIGAARMTYEKLLMQNGEIVRGKKNRIVHIAPFPIGLISWGVHNVTGVPWHIAMALIKSLRNDSVPTHDCFQELTGRTQQAIAETLATLAKEMEANASK